VNPVNEPQGRLDTVVASEFDGARISELDALTWQREHDATERLRSHTADGWLKGGRLRFEPRLRHGLRHALGRRLPPRRREFENLAHVRSLGLAAPRPMAAGVRWRAGLPISQWLWVEHVPQVTALPALDSARRADAIVRAAGELASIHASGLRHGDAHPRNLLVADDGTTVWIDIWRYRVDGRGDVSVRGRAGDLHDLLDGTDRAVRRSALDAYRSSASTRSADRACAQLDAAVGD
jgi:tRNA A-37 threonylcarbamoyl transferase component Bud32